ncbi:MAG TPA: ATP-grasp domain-containing protein, partial [Phototrophicaceae bacterium]|nr:ATP-grasp domain-containing protein [Phototrophicaceae bacterium]
FLSENEDFAQAVLDAGMIWVGPSPEAIRLMGVKTEARTLMAQANVPLVPGFASDTASDQEFIIAAEQIGFPVMVKAAGGGGGKGIRVVYQADELLEALSGARREAQKAFGDARVFLERYIETGRHIEVQVLADQHGNTIHLYERECSAQRRHQKIIEETPSPLLNDQQRQAIGIAAVKAAQAVNYVNAGTVEFIATKQGEFYFLEMNTRLQVEHPITELVTGVDIVKLQFQIASGEPLPFTQADVDQRGHAIECRIYAENPRNHFLPATGMIHTFIPPSGPGIRVDTYLKSGDEISIHYDPMIAKLIVYDRTREAAITRMRHALETTVVLGVTTNLEFLQTLLTHPIFTEGKINTAFIDSHLEELMPDQSPINDLALIAAALNDSVSTMIPTGKAVTSSQSTGSDAYSPWARSDTFRLHRK